MTYPTELVERAKYEVEVFERVSADTGIELTAEVVMLRSLVREMRAAAADVGARLMGIECEGTKFDALSRMALVIEESKLSVPEV